jgi:hypothetical protein
MDFAPTAHDHGRSPSEAYVWKMPTPTRRALPFATFISKGHPYIQATANRPECSNSWVFSDTSPASSQTSIKSHRRNSSRHMDTLPPLELEGAPIKGTPVSIVVLSCNQIPYSIATRLAQGLCRRLMWPAARQQMVRGRCNSRHQLGGGHYRPP